MNNKILPYRTSRGVDILLVYNGELGLAEVFKREHHAQRLTTWGYRFMGWVLVFFGVTCTSKLLHIICKYFQNVSFINKKNVLRSFSEPHYFSRCISAGSAVPHGC